MPLVFSAGLALTGLAASLALAQCRGAPQREGTEAGPDGPSTPAMAASVPPASSPGGAAGITPPRDSLPVVPGIEGTGTATRAGRGGRVIRVINLNDAGPGSLRAALGADGPRTVIFDVGGTITLGSRLVVERPFLTLAGQTAPSPGVTLRGAGLVIATHDVLVQHLRIRVGDDPSGPRPGSRDGLLVFGDTTLHGIVIDHVSVSWGIDELFTIYRSRGVTVRSSIFGEGLERSLHPEGPHSKGVFIAEGSRDFTFVGNLVAHNRDRNPGIKGNTSSIIVNNLIYNWGNGKAIPIWDSRSDPTHQPVLASIIGNVFIPGSDTPGRALCLEVYGTVDPRSRVYLHDNRCRDIRGDAWAIAEIEGLPSEVRMRQPPIWTALTLRPSAAVEAWVLANAGARPTDRDAVDERIIASVRNRMGRIIDSPRDVGGWPAADTLTSRRLALPAAPAADDDGDGYTNLEEWLHRLAAEVEGRAGPG